MREKTHISLFVLAYAGRMEVYMLSHEAGWLIFAIALFIIEGATFGLVSIWLAFGAIAAMIAAFFGADFVFQLLIFTGVSGLLLAFTRKLLKKYIIKKITPTNADRIVGASGVVTEEIDNQEAKGQIKVSGQTWSSRSLDGSVIPVGETIRVLEIQGVKAIVEKQQII